MSRIGALAAAGRTFRRRPPSPSPAAVVAEQRTELRLRPQHVFADVVVVHPDDRVQLGGDLLGQSLV
ncbi:hypothetical protein ACFVYA_36410, partial [Amycolatopsis sp. NPDC058278]|uniref:hypothetical protein n=1 Tax=Amycolatopsis sp. NPDC058278 TaxID=3346417 RepID=UPI0036D902C0